ncbi:Pancreatic lipase-related protein 2,Inactive pancreatic lipase-related protein 1 [Mytilus edulis]|uniref:Pancreatic lipase-related protein 2,Inactive pancreatic lipase-related protein 1 n=1 Tax=Mytilus edulis TaxID=6550 RepID=A0A8S3UB84_MYTED|nr:Pancreatic lipase-related protein 2,Inactive pancreatic lipase-related protein 1 [Mytilus edulis]
MNLVGLNWTIVINSDVVNLERIIVIILDYVGNGQETSQIVGHLIMPIFQGVNPSTADEQILDYKNVSSIRASSFDGSKKTKIIIHGYTHNGHRQWLQNMARAFLKKEDMNVIIVDWGHGAVPPYTEAAANTRVVGAQVAKLISVMVSADQSGIDKFHLIGHSLGAHVAGYAGERLTHLPRISGLDPADPYFQGTDIKVRLDPTDADFVDVIHTDGSSILSLGMGAAQQMGHVDFYPNGGSEQPGCPAGLLSKITQTVWHSVSQLDLLAGEGSVACSHERSYIYYTESILYSCPFMDIQNSKDEFSKGRCLYCDGGCSYMGYNADKSTSRGSMYLSTQAAAPYCNFHYQLNITANNSMDGKLTVVLQGSKGNTDAILLTPNEEVLSNGNTMTKFFTINKDIGNVTAVALRYDKTANLLLGWAYPNAWSLMGLSLLEAEKHRMDQFCAYGKSVQNHGATSFGMMGTC